MSFVLFVNAPTLKLLAEIADREKVWEQARSYLRTAIQLMPDDTAVSGALRKIELLIGR
ncbi:MAG: hypothetical protein HQL20_08115 [Candidatus Omnitrophica bacterium]|nr:hypothetical protein [Candidatus Omnitrophota bacterium]